MTQSHSHTAHHSKTQTADGSTIGANETGDSRTIPIKSEKKEQHPTQVKNNFMLLKQSALAMSSRYQTRNSNQPQKNSVSLL
jgi:hypothetical protein